MCPLLMAWLLLSCTPAETSLEQVRFTEDGFQLSLSHPVSDGWVELQDQTGKPLQRLPLPPGEKNPRLLFSWRSAQTYQFQLQKRTGNVASTSAQTLRVLQAPVQQPLRVKLHLPYGQNVFALESSSPQALPPEVAVPVPHTSTVTLGLELESLGDQTLQVSASLHAPTTLRVDPPLQLSQTLTPGHPPHMSLHSLHVPTQHEPRSPLELRVEATSSELPSPLHYALLVRLLPQALTGWQEGVKVQAWTLPTSPKGELEAHREPDVLVMPHPLWQKLGQGLMAGARPFDPYQPASWQTLSFENQLDWPVTVLLKAQVLDVSTKQELEAFVPRAFEVTGGLGHVTSLARVPARGTGQAILPLYVRPEVLEGTYLRKVEVQLLGLDEPLTTLEAPLYVRRQQPLLSSAVGLALLLSVAGTSFFLHHYRKLMQQLGTRALITIAMFGTLMFSVGFAMDMLTVGLNALLGPLNVLVTGLLYEGLHHLLLVALLRVYPRVGTVTLVGLTQYLMRGLTTGQVSPVDLLFLGSALALKELALWSLGVTRQKNRLSEPEPVTLRKLLPLLLALSGASGVSALLSLALHSALYRLFYAEWYWWANLGVAMLGPIPGIWLGAMLGQELNRVRD